MSKKKKSSGGLIAAMVALVLVILAAGGFGVYQVLKDTVPEEEQTASQNEGAEDPTLGPLGRLPAAKNEAEVINNLDFAISTNPDAVAWLQVPGTEINGLVMQGNDNNYYERRNEDGNYDVYGCYFADYECSLGTREDFRPNTVIYGHGNSMDDPDGKRFSQLFRYRDIDFAKKHPYLYLTTEEQKFTFEIFSVFYTDTSFDYIQVNLSDEDALALAREAEALSLYDYGLELAEGDRLLTLSTCAMLNRTGNNHRFVIMGRLCPESFQEKEEITLSPRE